MFIRIVVVRSFHDKPCHFTRIPFNKIFAARRFTLVYLAISYVIFAHHNRAYFGSAVPPTHRWLVPLTQLTLPAQLLAALLAPRRINWRGHELQIERGGTLRFRHRRRS